MAGLSPLRCGKRVKEALGEFGAVKVIAEKKQGGGVGEADTADGGRFMSDRAGACGAFEMLEKQLMAIAGAEDEDGLEAADALVQAMLMLAPPPNL